MLLVSFTSLTEINYLISSTSGSFADTDSYYSMFYNALDDDAPKPDYEVFSMALTGFFNLKAGDQIRNNILTIIDFSISSNTERMWIVDMNKMKVVHHSLVAHGRNSGDEFARSFSNKPSSYQSSLGFYLTDDIYFGRHGMSLHLDGIESNVNDNARERAIVIHGADYVSRDFIRNYGRLGRSFGCPSIPMENHEQIISLLSNGSCIYIYYPDEKYMSNSIMFNMEKTLKGIYSLLNETSLTFDIYPELLPLAVNF